MTQTTTHTRRGRLLPLVALGIAATAAIGATAAGFPALVPAHAAPGDVTPGSGFDPEAETQAISLEVELPADGENLEFPLATGVQVAEPGATVHLPDGFSLDAAGNLVLTASTGATWETGGTTTVHYVIGDDPTVVSTVAISGVMPEEEPTDPDPGTVSLDSSTVYLDCEDGTYSGAIALPGDGWEVTDATLNNSSITGVTTTVAPDGTVTVDAPAILDTVASSGGVGGEYRDVTAEGPDDAIGEGTLAVYAPAFCATEVLDLSDGSPVALTGGGVWRGQANDATLATVIVADLPDPSIGRLVALDATGAEVAWVEAPAGFVTEAGSRIASVRFEPAAGWTGTWDATLTGNSGGKHGADVSIRVTASVNPETPETPTEPEPEQPEPETPVTPEDVVPRVSE